MTESSRPSRWVSSGGLYTLPLGTKFFVSLFLCGLGGAYVSFLAGIWFDTGMQLSLIAEAYRDMSAMELTAHTFRYLTWFTEAFGVLGAAFLFTSAAERWKIFFCLWVPVWVLSDIGAAWLIARANIFAWQLFVSGFVLAMTFLLVFILVQRDLWFKR